GRAYRTMNACNLLKSACCGPQHAEPVQADSGWDGTLRGSWKDNRERLGPLTGLRRRRRWQLYRRLPPPQSEHEKQTMVGLRRLALAPGVCYIRLTACAVLAERR